MREPERSLNDEIELQFHKARLAEPGEDLRARILAAAVQTWKEAPAEIPWRIPLRRLGLSAVAAAVIVSCANHFSTLLVAPWQADRPGTTPMAVADSEDVAEMPYSPFVRHLIATCGPRARDASALLDYLQKARETSNEAERDSKADGSGPAKRESPKGKIGIMEHRDGGRVASLERVDSHHPLAPTFDRVILSEGVFVCIDDPRES
jgi:hypothetical protein